MFTTPLSDKLIYFAYTQPHFRSEEMMHAMLVAKGLGRHYDFFKQTFKERCLLDFISNPTTGSMVALLPVAPHSSYPYVRSDDPVLRKAMAGHAFVKYVLVGEVSAFIRWSVCNYKQLILHTRQIQRQLHGQAAMSENLEDMAINALRSVSVH